MPNIDAQSSFAELGLVNQYVIRPRLIHGRRAHLRPSEGIAKFVKIYLSAERDK